MPKNRTLLATSHGTDSVTGAAAISALVDAVRERLVGQLGDAVTVVETYVDVQHPQVDEVLTREVTARPNDVFTVVPLLLSTGYHVRQDIADAAFQVSSETGTKVNISPALGPDQRLVEVLVERLAQTGATTDDLIVLCAAGSSDPRAVAEVELVQAMLDETLTLKWGKSISTELAYLSAAEPKLKDLVPKLKFQNPRKRVVVATYLLAPGFFADKTLESGAHLATAPLLEAPASSGEPTPPPSLLVDLIVDRFELASQRSGQTGCLDGLSRRASSGEFAGCAAGCLMPCRQPA